MGKTYRFFSHNIFRSPRGRCRALINNVRKGAIPPDPWEDISLNKECIVPWAVARKMMDDGFSQDVIRRKLMRKFRLQSWQVSYIFSYIWR